MTTGEGYYCHHHQTFHPKKYETHYLPMDCPNCGRRRLLYDGYHVICEKCGVADWVRLEDKVQVGEQKTKQLYQQDIFGAPGEEDERQERIAALKAELAELEGQEA